MKYKRTTITFLADGGWAKNNGVVLGDQLIQVTPSGEAAVTLDKLGDAKILEVLVLISET